MINKTATQQIAVSNTASELSAQPGFSRVIRVFANRMIHVAVGVNSVATTTTGVPVAPFQETFFAVPSGEEVSFILATGETSGSVWTTEQ